MKKILIVDDVKLLREIQERYLATTQVNVFTAESGEEALEFARREHPDLIIMDRYMPGIDGLACCAALKADPTISGIPVIMTTSVSRQEDTDQCIRSGADDVISKPLEAGMFLDMVQKYLPEIDRRAPRVPETLPLKIAAEDSQYDAATGDISVSGAFAVSDLHVSVNEELKFSFLLPGKEVPIEILGRVVWLRKGGGASGFGVEFGKVTGQGLPILRARELKDFIQAKVKK